MMLFYRSNHELPIPQNSLDAIERAVIPVINKLRCSPSSGGTTSESEMAHLVSVSQYICELYVQQAVYGKVISRIRKVRPRAQLKFIYLQQAVLEIRQIRNVFNGQPM